MSAIITTRPTVKAASSACSRLSPTVSWKKSCRCPAIPGPPVPFHSGPNENPSKLVEPIITHSSATVPGTGVVR